MAQNFDNLFYIPLSDTGSSENISGMVTTTGSEENASSSSKLTPAAAPIDSPTESKTPTQDESNLESLEYKPMSHHWFYSTQVLDKLVWTPMSFKDTNNLEKCFVENKLGDFGISCLSL
jgi:hypothetical protein